MSAFIRSANHDETTKEFADKTYDRAHVMEVKRSEEEIDITNANTEQYYVYIIDAEP